MNKDIEFLKNFFKYSSENVMITDYDFNIIWCSSGELSSCLKGKSCRGIFENADSINESGKYYVRLNGLVYDCSIIKYPGEDSGIYVIQLGKDDVLFSFIKSQVIQEFIINRSAAVRHAVTGISVSGNKIYESLDKSLLKNEKMYLNIAMGNCYKLLKSSMDMTELVRYTDGSIESRCICLSRTLGEFARICNDLMRGQKKVNVDYQPDLFIKADADRLTACLLSMVILSGGGDNNIIVISAERIGSSVSITVSGCKSETSYKPCKHSTFSEMYQDNSIRPECSIIDRFCKEFGGTLYAADEAGQNKSYSIRLPYCGDEPETIFRSDQSRYSENKFSCYHIALSEIVDIDYYQ